MDPHRGLADWTLTAHARFEMGRRGIPSAVVALVVRHPQQRFAVRAGRDVFQRRVALSGRASEVLVRVFVDVQQTPPEVVTVYQTSKIAKYWRPDP